MKHPDIRFKILYCHYKEIYNEIKLTTLNEYIKIRIKNKLCYK